MDSSFGAALRERRRAAGFSQRELAERTGLDFSYISKIENGRLPPPAADTVVAICRVLGVSAEEMLALMGRIPSDIQRTISTSRAAQAFLRETQTMNLTDMEWEQIANALKELRKRP